MKKACLYIAVILIASLSERSYSQVSINEISNANASSLYDGGGEGHDWIELYNAGPAPVSLLNYALSDDESKPEKWRFPDVGIGSNSFLIVFASGKDTLIGKDIHVNFKLKSTGETLVLSNDKGKVIDNFILGALQVNHSTGRNMDGGTKICVFNAPTPGASNNNSSCYDGYEPDPIFSVQAGFYTSSQVLELYTPSPTGQVKYSLDGKIPSVSSSSYSSAINISKTMVVSAVCYSSANRLPSKAVKQSFFINEDGVGLPVISITMNPDDLFSESTGIYVNYTKDWERECRLEYFDKNKVKQFELNAGIKINGGNSKAKPQKSFRITFRKKYGASRLHFPLIPEKPIDTYKAFTLRNGGTDYGHTRIRDAFLQRVMKNGNVGIMGYEPAVVFLNGEYWGEYQIREKQDERYIESNYGVPAEEVDVLTHKGTLRVLAGSDKSFYKLHSDVMSGEPKSNDYYASVGAKLNLENFADYFIANIYFGNKDWLKPTGGVNNVKLWNSRLNGGKWNYLFWDMDMACGLYNGSPSDNKLAEIIDPSNGNVHTDMFSALVKNPTFKNYFVNRYADLLNTVFLHDSLTKIAYAMRDSISSSMPRHLKRWEGTMETWDAAMDKMVEWPITRNEHVRNHIQSQFNLNKQVEVKLAASPPGAGRIVINSVIPQKLPWTGVYFDGVPVTITAIPNPGFTFDHWGANKNLKSANFNNVLNLNIDSTDIFTAHFTGSATEPKITISEINYNSSKDFDPGDWIELHNYGNIPLDLTGWYIKGNGSEHYQVPFGTILQPNGYMVFCSDMAKFSSHFPLVLKADKQLPFNLSNSSEQISLVDHNYKTVLSVTYSNTEPWPTQANGKGRTLELKNPAQSLDLGSNWFAGCPGGSPGAAYNSQCLLGVKDEVPQKPLEVQIWPNPSNDFINIKIISSGTQLKNLSISLFDFMGNEVKKITSIDSSEITISKGGHPPGMYVVKIGNGTFFITEKVILY